MSVAPKEAVGLILDDGSTLRLRNWSRRQDRFLVGRWRILWNLGWDTLRHGTGISLIYHSHAATTQPSLMDRQLMHNIESRWPHVDHLIFVPGTEYSIWQYEG